MRIVGTFEKSERLRHIGHLDLMRAMQRALRRSGLPIAYSKGFTPHVLVTFGSALSVGAVGRKEIVDVTMAQDITPEQFVQTMNGALPPEMMISSAWAVDDRHPAAMALVAAADYSIRIDDEKAYQVFKNNLEGFMSQQSIVTPRKTKSGIKDCEIRPLIYSISCQDGYLNALLALTEAASCKPDMLLTALCAYCGMEDKPHTMIIRNELLGKDEAGTLVSLEKL